MGCFLLISQALFFELAEHANKMAQIIVVSLKKAGYSFLTDSPSNQIFPILPDALIEKLQKNWSFYVWEKVDEKNSAIRLVTSLATQEETVRAFVQEF